MEWATVALMAGWPCVTVAHRSDRGRGHARGRGLTADSVPAINFVLRPRSPSVLSRLPTVDSKSGRSSACSRRDLLVSGIVGVIGVHTVSAAGGSGVARGSSEVELTVSEVDDSAIRQETADPAAVGMSPQGLQRIVDRLQAETTDGAVRSASVLVARRGSVVLHGGFGRLSPAAGSPPTAADTTYLLASITKPVTACGLMLLVEQGRVVLSDPVQRYLPDFAGEHKDKVRVWHLLSHVSGLPDQLPENTALRQAHAPLSEFVRHALQTPLLFEPGTRFSYQSMGTLLAGEIIERMTGMRLRDYLQQEVFRPLGMHQTSLGLGDTAIADTAIVETAGEGAPPDDWGPNSPYWRDMGHPWGGLHSTTGDLARLFRIFLNGGRHGRLQLLSPATSQAMIRNRNPPALSPFGLGWALRDSQAANHFGDLGTADTFGHVGATGTVAWADPVRQLICILLTTQPAAADSGLLLNAVSNLAQAAVMDV